MSKFSAALVGAASVALIADAASADDVVFTFRRAPVWGNTRPTSRAGK